MSLSSTEIDASLANDGSIAELELGDVFFELTGFDDFLVKFRSIRIAEENIVLQGVIHDEWDLWHISYSSIDFEASFGLMQIFNQGFE